MRAALPLLALLACAQAACAEPAPPAPIQPEPAGPSSPPLEFAFETTEGGVLRAADLRGRLAVIALVASYDLDSQAQVRVLSMLWRRRAPRINVAAILLDPPENRPLLGAFTKSLDLHYPVGIADERTIAGRGPFAGLRGVPSVVILDQEGREVFRHIGAMDERALRAELDRIDPRRPTPRP